MATPAYMSQVLRRHSVGTGDTLFTFMGRTTPAQIAFPTATPVAAGTIVQKPVAVPAVQVRRYPGDPRPFTRRAYTRQSFKYRAERTPNNVTAGRRFWVTAVAVPPGTKLKGVKWLQFTTRYSVTDAIDAHRAFGVINFWLRSPGGIKYFKAS